MGNMPADGWGLVGRKSGKRLVAEEEVGVSNYEDSAVGAVALLSAGL